MKKCNQKWFNPQKVKKQIAIAVAISLVCAIPVSYTHLRAHETRR